MRRHGPPEVLEWDTVDLDRPQVGEVLVRHTAVGLNFIDVYHREGLYPLGLPFTPGVEAAGVIEELGPGVTDFRQGDRVAYTGNGPPGWRKRFAWPRRAAMVASSTSGSRSWSR